MSHPIFVLAATRRSFAHLQEILADTSVHGSLSPTVKLDQTHLVRAHRHALLPGGRARGLDEAGEVQVRVEIGWDSALPPGGRVGMDVRKQRRRLKDLRAFEWFLVCMESPVSGLQSNPRPGRDPLPLHRSMNF